MALAQNFDALDFVGRVMHSPVGRPYLCVGIDYNVTDDVFYILLVAVEEGIIELDSDMRVTSLQGWEIGARDPHLYSLWDSGIRD